MFPVENDDTLGRLIALFLHNRLFGNKLQNGHNSLKEMGWGDSLVNEMYDMPINDVAKILSGPNACLGVVFDHRKAAAVVNSYRAIKRDQHDLDFFILNGATPTLIRALFPTISARVVAQQRKRLGCESRGGRPPLPDADTAHAIYRCWQTLCAQEPNLRCRYRRLKQHFPALSLATLCAAIESN
ncbi:MAG: STY4526/YPO1902 family pathogenicity island replication protein [Rhizobacter sp.]